MEGEVALKLAKKYVDETMEGAGTSKMDELVSMQKLEDNSTVVFSKPAENYSLLIVDMFVTCSTTGDLKLSAGTYILPMVSLQVNDHTMHFIHPLSGENMKNLIMGLGNNTFNIYALSDEVDTITGSYVTIYGI